MNTPASARNTDATVHVSSLAPPVTDALLWELFQTCGPISSVYVPRDRITGQHKGFAFVEYREAPCAAYACAVLNLTPLFGKALRLSQSTPGRRVAVGANLFVGNLAPGVDERLLHEAFGSFGALVDAPHVMRGEDGVSKGFGFVKFATFASSDRAIEVMHGQYVCNQPLVVQYAFKKDGGGQERHGSEAERLLAEAAAEKGDSVSGGKTLIPHTMFADGPRSAQGMPPPPPVYAQAYPPAYQQQPAYGQAMAPPPYYHQQVPQQYSQQQAMAQYPPRWQQGQGYGHQQQHQQQHQHQHQQQQQHQQHQPVQQAQPIVQPLMDMPPPAMPPPPPPPPPPSVPPTSR